jgi:hypothetical protein
MVHWHYDGLISPKNYRLKLMPIWGFVLGTTFMSLKAKRACGRYATIFRFTRNKFIVMASIVKTI